MLLLILGMYSYSQITHVNTTTFLRLHDIFFPIDNWHLNWQKVLLKNEQQANKACDTFCSLLLLAVKVVWTICNKKIFFHGSAFKARASPILCCYVMNQKLEYFLNALNWHYSKNIFRNFGRSHDAICCCCFPESALDRSTNIVSIQRIFVLTRDDKGIYG